MNVQPYIFFDGRCDEAITFYKAALGATVTVLMRYKDHPQPGAPESGAGCEGIKPDMVMHASLRIGESEVMVSDGRGGGNPQFEGVSMSLGVADAAEAQRVYDALLPGGKVVMPLGPSFFSPAFGMVVDRFGVHWMVVAAPK
ncbi:MAG TPA: VOC family protein [Humisphaera sp.]